MANPFFKFKQFTNYQDKCAMKVTTDACLFGAVVASLPEINYAKNILDIGAGTGLLSLMLAQQNLQANIDAVEIDIDAYTQAKSNFVNSPWDSRLNIYHENILTYKLDPKYDLIISNPPFFENSLLSANPKRNAALHHSTFLLSLFPAIIDDLLMEEGHFFVLLSFQNFTPFLHMMEAEGYGLIYYFDLMQTDKHLPFRVILGFQKGTVSAIFKNSLTIKSGENYTPEFIELLKPYYLYL